MLSFRAFKISNNPGHPDHIPLKMMSWNHNRYIIGPSEGNTGIVLGDTINYDQFRLKVEPVRRARQHGILRMTRFLDPNSETRISRTRYYLTRGNF